MSAGSLNPYVEAHRPHAGHTTPNLRDSLNDSSSIHRKEGLGYDGTATEAEDDRSMQARVERLGRERPLVFRSIWAEIAFVFSICMSQVITEYFFSGFPVILPTLIEDLHIPQSSSVWPATAFPLAIAATLLFFGRLGDMYGGLLVYAAGMTWLAVWSIVAGFSFNPLMLEFCRALQGLGAAASLPNAVLLMGSIYRPGPRKNLVFSIYGAAAVFGFFLGIFVAGVVGQYGHWGWYFWVGAIMAAISVGSSFSSIPSDRAQRRKNGVGMDWLGSALIVSGLTLTVYAITDSSHSLHGWRTPYIPTLLTVGCLLLAAAIYVEGWVASLPLLPFDVFAVKSMKALTIALFFVFGTLAIYLLWATQYMAMFMAASPLKVAVCAIFATIGMDITFNVANIFLTTNMPHERQGLAGGLINSILHLGITFCLCFSDIIQSATVNRLGLWKSYKAVFWFGVAAASGALLIMAFFVTVEKAKSDLTVDEKRELEKAVGEEGQNHNAP